MNNVYSFLDVSCAIVGPGGSFSMGAGSANSEEGITVEPSGDINTMQVGADGEGQHSLHGDKSGTAVVRLLKTSPVNQQLMDLYNFQTASASQHGQNTITLRDLRGDEITLRQVAFTKVPPLTYAKDAGMNEWGFSAIKIDRQLGGGSVA